LALPHLSAIDSDVRNLKQHPIYPVHGWLGSRVDSGAEGPGFKSQPRRCRVTVLGNCSHPSCLCSPSSEIVAALLRVARVTVGLAESDSSLPPVCDSCNLQADCQEPGSTPEPYARQLSMGYVFLPTALYRCPGGLYGCVSGLSLFTYCLLTY